MTEAQLKVHFDRMRTKPVREAYEHLASEARGHALVISYTTGRVPAVRLHDADRRYLFSFIPNRTHLLFYLRKPAFTARRASASEALSQLRGASRNPSGEVTIRVETLAEAQKLSAWLMPLLPLPQTPGATTARQTP